MEAFQQRVVDEESELTEKLNKLGEFIRGKIFQTLPEAERSRLQEQDGYMRSYVDVLRRRIAAFKTD